MVISIGDLPLTGIFNRCDHWLHLVRLATHSFSSFLSFQKTRIQISSEYGALGMSGTVRKVVSGEGVGALWKGVNAAWLREASYTSLRLGLYEPCKIAFGCTTPENTTFLKKFAAGSAAGALGSLTGNPFDVLKTKSKLLYGIVESVFVFLWDNTYPFFSLFVS